MPTINVHNFKPNNLNSQFFSMAVYASRAAGKTTFLTYLMLKMLKSYEHIYLFSNSIDVKNDFKRYIGADFVKGYEDLDETIENIKAKMTNYYNENRRRQNGPGGCGTFNGDEYNPPSYPSTLLLLDDIITNKNKTHSDGLLNDLADNGRHWHISFIVCLQHSHAVGPNFRQNLTYASIMLQNSSKSRETLADEYMGSMRKADATKFIERYTKDHSVLIVSPTPHGMTYYKFKVPS